ncbi:MAG: polysaccharide deacetylase family protein [Gammaproteobacteria bacterium]
MPQQPVSVLMYHAIVDDGEDAAGADLHYAVSRQTFGHHLELARRAGLAVASVRALLDSAGDNAVAFTFDDGHSSNAWAAEALRAAGASADFFVNSAHVGQRGFLDWAALRDMAAAGMSIQSHGHQHRYLDELDPSGVEDELRRSKQIIEDGLGRPVTLFAPPGGRVAPGLVETARRLGYDAVCSSRVGVWRGLSLEVPRFAILRGTTAERTAGWMARRPREVLASTLRYELLRAGKGLLGNGAYDKLRAALLARR